jgi:hypothetical protein
MVSRKAQPSTIATTLEPERAHDAIKKQLALLQGMRGKSYIEADQEEMEWRTFTENVIELSFGKPSSTMENFYRARSAGNYRMVMFGEPEPHDENQRHFEMRINALEAFLNACLSQLELRMPKREILGHYEAGQQYEFYRDLKLVLAKAGASVMIIDAYLGVDIFDLYAGGISRSTALRMLTNRVKPDVLTVAQKYAAGGNFQLRISDQIHDRLIFIDNRVWLIGQSIKDAASNKPTYIVEHDATVMKPTYETLWASATPVA